MAEPEERDLAHEADMRALMRQQLEADCGGEMADDSEEDFMGDPDEYDEHEDHDCPQCWGDGRDPDCDYLLPCPVCQCEQQPPEPPLTDARVRDQDSLFGCLPTAPEEKM
jgi:hypothetical protein